MASNLVARAFTEVAHVVHHHRDRSRSTGTSLPLLAVARHFAERRRPGPLPHRRPVRRGRGGHRRRALPLPRRSRLRRPAGPGQTSRSAPGSRARRRSPSTSSTSSCAPAAPSTTRSWPRTRDEPADALLTDPAFAGGAFLLGHPLGVRPPIVVCGVIPLTIASRDTAPYGMGLTPLRGPLGRLRNALLSAVAARTVFPRAERMAQRGQPRAARASAAVPGPRLAAARRGDRAVHGPRVRVPPLRRPRDSALRRPDLGHRLRGAAARRGGTSSTARGRSSTSPRGRSRTATTGRSSPRPSRRSPTTTCSSSSPPAAARSTRSRRCPRTPGPRRTCRTTSCCPGPTSTSPTAATAASSTPCATASPSSRAAARRTSPRSPARVAWSGVGRRLKTETPSPAAVGAAVRSVLHDPSYRARAQTHRREHGPRRRDRRTHRARRHPRVHGASFAQRSGVRAGLDSAGQCVREPISLRVRAVASAAEVASWPLSSLEPVEPGAVERLLLGVAREYAEPDGDRVVEGDPRQPVGGRVSRRSRSAACRRE